MTIINFEAVNQYRDANTREIEMPDGSLRAVRMTPELWESLDFILEFEEITIPELATFAKDEMETQQVSFDRAFRGVVAYLANRWK